MIWRSGQKRGVTPSIRKAIHRRSTVESTIGHMKNEGELRQNAAVTFFWTVGVS